MSQLVKDLERELSAMARNLREPVTLADGTVVRRTTASLLYFLGEHEPARMGDIAAALNVDPSTTTRQVQHAIRAGLLAREGGHHDRRVVMLSLTSAGRDLYETLIQRQRQGLLHILDGWPDQDQEDLVRLISLFNGEIDALRAATLSARRSDRPDAPE
ncbi:MarR family winged helix-turn-helix transcriptional regulator [Nocardioides sp. CFH 31398]|uniref:MarR family winged helix-turn-helix transcriptional regulator n=1 Tax=Nocardioides sp. CFH 31398 TaxID=2919579 RepID=UPI001F05D6C2|nr:MarR family transcriptional regulator [Nocardioides sp. CFH 31398]MCH1867731.1 MarR family transcriptional regulator [Nocardioides sp. CFH 31398]